MDSALVLKRKLAAGETIANPLDYLASSVLIQKYTELENLTMLGKIFALIGLAEIPFAEKMLVTQELLHFIDQHVVTEKGFSYTGKADDIVPCYNAMLLEAYCRLGRTDSLAVQNALHWIKSYQTFERGQLSAWPGAGVCRFGGCLKVTPCYIGIGKTVRGLIAYQEYARTPDETAAVLLEKGLDYMAKHQMFKRLSQDQPISAHITESMFPQSYVLSLTDLVYIAVNTNHLSSEATHALRDLVASKRRKTGGWKSDYIYRYNGYLSFNDRRNDSPWITELYQMIE